MSFQQGLSGLSAAAKNLDVIGNNVANSSTVGFKGSQAQFADVFASAISGSVGTQSGLGTQLAIIAQQFDQGNITSTNNSLDMAINGQGFFRMDKNNSIVYARNGQFQLDKNGYIINSLGHKLTGYPVDPVTGATLPLGPLSISTAALSPVASAGVTVGLNLDARSAFPTALSSGNVTGNAAVGTLVIGAGNNTLNVTVDGVASGAVTIPIATYTSTAALAAAIQSAVNADPLLAAAGRSVAVATSANILTMTSASAAGATSSVAAPTGSAAANLFGAAPVVTAGATVFSPTNPSSYNSSTSLTTYDSLGNSHVATLYFQKASANAWNVYLAMDGALVPAAGTPMGVLGFTTSGVQSLPAGGVFAASPFTPPGAATMNLTFDCATTTQFGALFGVTRLSQTGYTSGQLSGFSTASDGTIQGRYSNGQSMPMGQIVMANFANAQGLQPLGNNEWADTAASGAALIGTPGAGSLGVLQSSALEDSNVDLTDELVQMITAQRVYQANAQTIKAQDAILQTITNLR